MLAYPIPCTASHGVERQAFKRVPHVLEVSIDKRAAGRSVFPWLALTSACLK